MKFELIRWNNKIKNYKMKLQKKKNNKMKKKNQIFTWLEGIDY
jgi:hypothetical protein